MRQFDVFSDREGEHKTGRSCPFCSAPLLETGVAFGETYRDPLDAIKAEFHARKSHLAIILGTSMNVQSSASYPEKVCLLQQFIPTFF